MRDYSNKLRLIVITGTLIFTSFTNAVPSLQPGDTIAVPYRLNENRHEGDAQWLILNLKRKLVRDPDTTVFLTVPGNLDHAEPYSGDDETANPGFLQFMDINSLDFALKVYADPQKFTCRNIKRLTTESIIFNHFNRYLIPKLWLPQQSHLTRLNLQLTPFSQLGDLSVFMKKPSSMSTEDDSTSDRSNLAQHGSTSTDQKAIEKVTSLDREKMIFQITDTLALLHQKGYSHASIKPENILVSAKQLGQWSLFRLFLIDFDSCVKYQKATFTEWTGLERLFACGKPKAIHIRLGSKGATPLALNAHHLTSLNQWSNFSPFLLDIDGLTLTIIYITGMQYINTPSDTMWRDIDQEILNRASLLPSWREYIEHKNHSGLEYAIKKIIEPRASGSPTPDHHLFQKLVPFLATLQIQPFSRSTIRFNSLS